MDEQRKPSTSHDETVYGTNVAPPSTTFFIIAWPCGPGSETLLLTAYSQAMVGSCLLVAFLYSLRYLRHSQTRTTETDTPCSCLTHMCIVHMHTRCTRTQMRDVRSLLLQETEVSLAFHLASSLSSRFCSTRDSQRPVVSTAH